MRIKGFSLWTTSAARLVLLKYMQNVLKMPGATLLYTGNCKINLQYN